MRREIIATIALLTVVTGLFAQSEGVERMRRDLSLLSADSLMGRASGTIYEAKAASLIEKSFLSAGIDLLYPHPGQDFSFLNESGDTLRSQNIVAIVEGWHPTLKEEYLLIGAHYDHLGYNTLTIDGEETLQIYRGANSNSSGVALLLELARLVKRESFNFKRSLLFVAFGAKEERESGSWYFANRAFAPVDKISLMVNLERVGRAFERDEVKLYSSIPHPQLTAIAKRVSTLPLMIAPKIESGGSLGGDHNPFLSLGIPSLLVTTTGEEMELWRDNPESIKYEVMEDIAHYLLNLTREVANLERPLVRNGLSEKSGLEEGAIYSQNEVESPATFMKRDERGFMEEWVYHYLRYPESAVKEGIQGRVVVDFIVEKGGELSNIEIVRSLDERLDNEVLRVIKASPKWKAARLAGAAVRVKISLSVEFRLKEHLPSP